MTTTALLLVLLAAVLHAVWNAVVKGASDRGLVLAALSATHAIIGAGMLMLAVPPAVASWPYIVASALLHYGYIIFLYLAYRVGDLSHVYPVSRGLAPVLVALGAYVFAGEILSTAAWTGLIVVALGIFTLFVFGGGLKANPTAMLAALANGGLIASYSVVDGIGVRLSDSPFGYMGWLFLLEAPVVIAVLSHHRVTTGLYRSPAFRAGLTGGVLAVSAYGLVLYAKTIAPLGAVSAVRESSVIFAALIGVVWFGERPWLWRLLAAVISGAGVVLLAAAD